MCYVEMTIDSIRYAMYRGEWMILLKEKDGQRYLPVYVDKVWADMVGKILRSEDDGLSVDDELKRVVAMGNEAKLVIDVNGYRFRAKFVGRKDDIEYPVGKGLAVATRGGMGIRVEGTS